MVLRVLHTLVGVLALLVLGSELRNDRAVVRDTAAGSDLAVLEQDVDVGVTAFGGTTEFVEEWNVHEFEGRVGTRRGQVADVVVGAGEQVGRRTPVETVDPSVDLEAAVGEAAKA